MLDGPQKSNPASKTPATDPFVLTVGFRHTLSRANRGQASTVGWRRRRQVGAFKPTGDSATRRIAAEGWTFQRDKGFEDKNSNEDDVIASASISIQKSQQSPALSSIRLPHNAVDPFKAFSVKMSYKMHSLLLFCRDDLIYSRFRGELLVTGKSAQEHQFFENVQQRLRSCILGDQMDLHGLLAAVASRKAALLTNEDSPAHPIDNYVQATIGGLHKQIAVVASSQAPLVSLLLPIYNLMVMEIYRGDLEAALVHLRFFCASFSQEGVPMGHVNDMQCFTDVALAAEADSRPILQDAPWQPLPLSRNRLDHIRLEVHDSWVGNPNGRESRDSFSPLSSQSVRGQHFATDYVLTRNSLLTLLSSFITVHTAIAGIEVFSTDMCALIDTEFKPWCYMAIWCFGRKRGIATELDGQWLERMSIYISHKLLLLKRPNASSLALWEYVEYAIRLSLITILSQVYNQWHWRVTTANVRRTKAALDNIALKAGFVTNAQRSWDRRNLLQQWSSAQISLLSWVLQAGQIFADNVQDCSWFLARATIIAEVLQIRDESSAIISGSKVELPGFESGIYDLQAETTRPVP